MARFWNFVQACIKFYFHLTEDAYLSIMKMIIYAENSPYYFVIAPLPSLPIRVFCMSFIPQHSPKR